MATAAMVVLIVVSVLGVWMLTRGLRPLSAESFPPGPPTHPESASVSEPEPESVSVVVPARDEAATVPILLASLSRQTTRAAMRILVVDDDSRDRTTALARRAGGEVLSLTGPPPPGWVGKAWACHRGAESTHEALLVFLDADTELAPDAVRVLIELRRRHGGLVSVQPHHLVPRAYEQLSAHFNVVSVVASGAFGPRPQRRPMAFGPCLVTSRDDYHHAGGHAAVRAEILDDVELARAYRGAGLSVRCFAGGSLLRMRMYPGGFAQLAEGWTKNMASGASAAAPVRTAVTVAWLAGQHAGVVGVVTALVGLAGPHPTAATIGDLVVWATVWMVYAGQLRSLLTRTGSFRWWTWALFPIPLAVFDLLFLRSLVRTLLHQRVRWRGRAVDVGSIRSTSRPS